MSSSLLEQTRGALWVTLVNQCLLAGAGVFPGVYNRGARVASCAAT